MIGGQTEEWEKLREQVIDQHGQERSSGGVSRCPARHSGRGAGQAGGRGGTAFRRQGREAARRDPRRGGFDRSKIYVTTIIKLRPTTENNGSFKNRPPKTGEIREGLEVLRSELRIVDHSVLVLLGSTPAKALIERLFTLKSGRGDWFESQLSVPALATYHPAYLLRLSGDDYEQTRELVVKDLGTAW